MREVNAGKGAGAEVIRAMGYKEILRLAKSMARMESGLRDERYRTRMIAGTIPNRLRRSGLVVAAAVAVVGLPD